MTTNCHGTLRGIYKIAARLLLVLSVSWGWSRAQTPDFYYYGGKKVYLTAAPDVTAAKIQSGVDFETKFPGVRRLFTTVKSTSAVSGETVIYSKSAVKPEAAARVLSVGLATHEIFRVSSYRIGTLTVILQNEIIVQFKDMITAECRTSRKFADDRVPKEYEDQLLRGFANNFTPIDGTTSGLFRVVIENASSTLRVANILQGNCTVNYAAPNFMVVVPPETEMRWKAPAAASPNGPLSPSYPSDPLFARQWSLENKLTNDNEGKVGSDIRIRGAWDVTKGSAQVRVAVLDDGVDVNHPDLAYNIAKENGKIVQWDAIFDSDQQQPSRGDRHGTAVAGVIAAHTDNGIGMSGVAPLVKIVPIRMGSAEDSRGGWTTPLLVYQAIQKAVQLKADVINGSWQIYPHDLVDSAVKSASTAGRNGKGVVMVFAAGNDGGPIAYPARLSAKYQVIAVGAINSWGQIKDRKSNDHEAWASSRGPELSLVAPGVGIISTALSSNNKGVDGPYVDDFNGTSSAAPQVAGVVALLLSVHPEFDATTVRDRITQTTDKIDGQSSRTDRAGWGRLNACRALSGKNCD